MFSKQQLICAFVITDHCLHKYGSCNLFQVYDVLVPHKKANLPRLRSATSESFQHDIEVIEDTGLDVVVPQSICTVGAADLSTRDRHVSALYLLK